MTNKAFESVIYIVCNPDGIPMRAYTVEQDAKNHVSKEMLERGERFSIDLVSLEVSMEFAERAKDILEGLALKKKREQRKNRKEKS